MLNIINERGVQFSLNSTTPLSVKEQTEVINELVSNGEESAFAVARNKLVQRII